MGPMGPRLHPGDPSPDLRPELVPQPRTVVRPVRQRAAETSTTCTGRRSSTTGTKPPSSSLETSGATPRSSWTQRESVMPFPEASTSPPFRQTACRGRPRFHGAPPANRPLKSLVRQCSRQAGPVSRQTWMLGKASRIHSGRSVILRRPRPSSKLPQCGLPPSSNGARAVQDKYKQKIPFV